MSNEPDLTSTAAAVLSLLLFGEASGYELRSRADATLRFFFAAPAMSQIYAELDRLAETGLVSSRTAQRPGSRPGRQWRLTARGRRRLARWASEEPVPPTVYRDHLALRLMLGGLVAPERLQEMVDEQIDRVTTDRDELVAVAEALDPDDPELAHPALVAEWGLATFATEIASLERIRDQLAHTRRSVADVPRAAEG